MGERVRDWLRLWFTFERRVGRREYLASGVGLALLKYAGDALLVWTATGRLWPPADYLSPVHSVVSVRLAHAPPYLLPAMAVWAVPFLWIGVSMSMRRALDAGTSAWTALLFFVPYLSYAFMAAMSVVPSDPSVRPVPEPRRPDDRRLPGALLAVAAGAAVGLGMIALSVYTLASYGISLFLGTPFVVGALTAFLFNRRYPATMLETQEVVLMTLACTGGALLATAAEGALCLLMVLPLAVLLGALGAVLGRRIARHDPGPAAHAAIAVLVLPMSAAFDVGRPAAGFREVRSAVVVDAPPDVVWRHVVSFPPLPEPSALVFRMGIAYPQRARRVGQGVGAVRYCVFSTGPFVEPITRWEPGRRLAFDVASQPPALEEWSPYARVTPPHLHDYFRARRGEFRLVPLPGGRTRLEGSTWYEMRIFPEAYWVLFADALVARIHHRVLEHVRSAAESDG